MFYSEQLLSKTGPLARVWMAANVERKLSKSQVLQSDIQKSVDSIENPGQAPLALRLSGQLMLGVVRIYGKKAKYLQDDCHEALLKIRMTFKNIGSHDLPANAHVGLDLNLPEVLTIDDLFPNMDFAYPMTQPAAIEAASQDYDQDWTSTLNPQQSTQSRLSPEDDQAVLNDDDLGLDFGDDLGPNDTTVSVQIGRDAAAERTLEDEVGGGEKVYEDDDLNLDLGEDIGIDAAPGPIQPVNDVDMQVAGDIVEEAPLLGDDETLLLRQQAEAERQREGSALSEPGSDVMRDLDETFHQTAEEEVSEVAVKQRQQRRKFKPIVPDVETVLHNRQIKQQAEDRSKILRAPAFLPRDPFLLTLMEMQKNGDFVTQAMNDGRSKGWAPELQGLLSFDVVHRPNKRKRDSGIGGLSEDEHSEKSPRLDVLEDDIDIDIGAGSQTDGAAAARADDTLPHIHSDRPGLDEEEIGYGGDGEVDTYLFPAGDDDFNETTMPILHPADSGPVSLSTKRAVHLLCETFGGAPPDGTPSSQAKKSVLLQDMIPEQTTSREDATKMFFEVLVLATKDAIKVEQGDKHIGLPLRIRAKRGLWGDWADTTRAEEEGEAQAEGEGQSDRRQVEAMV
ncbi:hypothetical protein DV736_g6232, partial [Chaetothyriales sp. CBS 134916]